MWLDGQGVSAPWPSPFVPRVRRDARCIDGPPRGEAVGFVHLFVQGVVCAAFLAHIVGRWVRRASTVEIYTAEKVAECKLGAKSLVVEEKTGQSEDQRSPVHGESAPMLP